MSRSPRLWAAVYGVAFHAAVVAILIWVAAKNQANVPAHFWWITAPPFLVAAFVVYALLVGPYLTRRPTTKGAVFFDSAVGMFAECVVAVLTAIGYSLIASARASGGGAGELVSNFVSTSLFAFLWSFGQFFTQILVIGNAAGLVGWVVLKRLSRRAPPAGPARAA